MVLIKRLQSNLSVWSVLSLIFVTLILVPNISILLHVFDEANDNWYHIRQYLLKDYVLNTLTILFFAGMATAILGTSLAWMISVFDFPWRGFLNWGLILPLAIPPYIGAYAYSGMLNYTGVVQTFLRNSLGMQVDQRYFDLKTTEGAVFIFAIFLFPYVYTVSRGFFEQQSASLIECARVLGQSPWEIFFKVALPLARPAVVGGCSLVSLEVLNDYGVVKYFGVPTFSTAIFKTWFGLGDIDSAIKLSGVLIVLVIGILALERFLRGRKKFSHTTAKARAISRIRLSGTKARLAFIYAFFVFSLGFLVPTLQLIHWGLLTYRQVLNVKFLTLTLNSLLSALAAATLIIIIALVVANYSRLSHGLLAKICARVIMVGYSIPGAVIAVGVIVFFLTLDDRLQPLYRLVGPDLQQLVLTTSIVVLLFAYVVRFVAIGFNSVESGFEKVGRTFTEAARTLGVNTAKTFLMVDLKMIRPAILGGFLLALVDVLKELPLTLVLRPFNFDTLATKAFEYANDEMIHEAAIASLIIIFASLALIYGFHQVVGREENHARADRKPEFQVQKFTGGYPEGL